MQESFYTIKSTSRQIDDTPVGKTWIRHEVRLWRTALKAALRKAYGYASLRNDNELPKELKESYFPELLHALRFMKEGEDIDSLKKKVKTKMKRAYNTGKVFPLPADTELRNLIAPDFDAWVINTHIIGCLQLGTRITTKDKLFEVIDHIAKSNTIAHNMKQTILNLNGFGSEETPRSRNTVNNCIRDLLSHGWHYITADTEFDALKPLEYDNSVMLKYLQLSELPEDCYR